MNRDAHMARPKHTCCYHGHGHGHGIFICEYDTVRVTVTGYLFMNGDDIWKQPSPTSETAVQSQVLEAKREYIFPAMVGVCLEISVFSAWWWLGIIVFSRGTRVSAWYCFSQGACQRISSIPYIHSFGHRCLVKKVIHGSKPIKTPHHVFVLPIMGFGCNFQPWVLLTYWGFCSKLLEKWTFF